VEVPPLRERKDDIIKLAELFLSKFEKKYGTTKKLDTSARQALLDYPWYGNVRELRQLMERLTFLSSETTIEKEDLRLPIAEKAISVSADSNDSSVEFPEEGINLEEVEKDLILKALKLCGGNISEAARKLGLGREALRYRVKKFSISKSIEIFG
jgi:two-component system NtrC family response regulator